MNQLHHPNFIAGTTRTRGLRLLQFTTLVGVIGAVAMTGWLVSSKLQHNLNADISGQIIGQSSGAGLPSQSQAVPKLISTTTVNSVAPGLTSDTMRYAEQGTGKGFSVDLRTGAATTVVTTSTVGFIQRWWAPRSSAFIQVATQKGTAQYQISDGTAPATPAAGAVTTIALSPDGTHIAFIDASSDTPALTVTNSDGSAAHAVLATRAQGVQLDWLTNSVLVMSSRNALSDGDDLSLVSTAGDLAIIETGREHLDYTWSPDGSKLLVSYTIGDGSVALMERDLAGSADLPLGLATSADKCAWTPASTSIVCGVPHAGQMSSAAPTAQTATNDDIVRINLQTGATTTLYQSQQKIPVGVLTPLVSSSGSFFVFTNIFDSKLYQLSI